MFNFNNFILMGLKIGKDALVKPAEEKVAVAPVEEAKAVEQEAVVEKTKKSKKKR